VPRNVRVFSVGNSVTGKQSAVHKKLQIVRIQDQLSTPLTEFPTENTQTFLGTVVNGYRSLMVILDCTKELQIVRIQDELSTPLTEFATENTQTFLCTVVNGYRSLMVI